MYRAGGCFCNECGTRIDDGEYTACADCMTAKEREINELKDKIEKLEGENKGLKGQVRELTPPPPDSQDKGQNESVGDDKGETGNKTPD